MAVFDPAGSNARVCTGPRALEQSVWKISVIRLLHFPDPYENFNALVVQPWFYVLVQPWFKCQTMPYGYFVHDIHHLTSGPMRLMQIIYLFYAKI